MSIPFTVPHEAIIEIASELPKPRGKPRRNDIIIISAIIYVLKHGIHWRDLPSCYGPYKTTYNRFVRWSRAGVFDKILVAVGSHSDQDGAPLVSLEELGSHPSSRALLALGLFPQFERLSMRHSSIAKRSPIARIPPRHVARSYRLTHPPLAVEKPD